MKTFILPFILLLTFVFSCRENDIDEGLEKTASYDVYVGGTENLQVCYWKNNQKTILPGGDNLNGIQIVVDNNDVYVLAVNVDFISNIPVWYFWKNGVKYDVAQYLNVAPNTAAEPGKLTLFNKIIVNNGDVYFAGMVKNPTPTSNLDIYQLCYWKNGVKTVITNQSNEMIGGFEIFNNDIYIVTRKNFNYTNLSWDLVHYKNGVQFSSDHNSYIPSGYFKNSNEIFLLEKVGTSGYSTYHSYKNILTNATISFPTNMTHGEIKDVYWNDNDRYYIGDNFYYKNSNLVIINDPNGFNQIGHLITKDQNIYMTRVKGKVVKFYINDVETMSITDIGKGCFNSIFVVPN